MHKKKEVIQDVSLHDLDLANARPQGGQDVASMVNRMIKPSKMEITDKLRREVNKVVDRYIEQGVAELIPGVLFIDEVHMLDLECFTYLNRALESAFAPIVVLATNRGVCTIRGTDGIRSAHGVPQDLLDRLLIIRTTPYNREEIRSIIQTRSRIEGIPLEEEALDWLASRGAETSLRYAIHLLTPSHVLAQAQGKEKLEVKDVQEASELFFDARASAVHVTEHADRYLQ